MSLRSVLKILLPTLGAQYTAFLTIMLLPLAFLAPRFLQPLLAPKALEAEIILAQILMPALIALIGALITLSLVIHAYNEQTKQHALEIEKQRQHYESLASDEKKQNANFTKKLDYPSFGVI